MDVFGAAALPYDHGSQEMAGFIIIDQQDATQPFNHGQRGWPVLRHGGLLEKGL
jgi:hypothetical protein